MVDLLYVNDAPSNQVCRVAPMAAAARRDAI